MNIGECTDHTDRFSRGTVAIYLRVASTSHHHRGVSRRPEPAKKSRLKSYSIKVYVFRREGSVHDDKCP